MLKLVKLFWIVINIYANPKSFQAMLNSLKFSVTFPLNFSKAIMTGDFFAHSYDNFNSSSKVKLNDARIKPFTQLKKTSSWLFLALLISHSRIIFAIIYIMANIKKRLRD